MTKALFRGFYFITDNALSRQGNVRDVQDALAAGVAAVQYREKAGSFSQMLSEAQRLRALCQDIPFIVNDSLPIAMAVHADGLHVGRTDTSCRQARREWGSQKIIGVSVLTVAEALEAEREGADYIGLGPIFATSTKKDADPPCGIERIKEIKKACALPLVAIGGISLDNAAAVIEAGADGICAISATVGQADVEVQVRKFNKFFKKA